MIYDIVVILGIRGVQFNSCAVIWWIFQCIEMYSTMLVTIRKKNIAILFLGHIAQSYSQLFPDHI